MSGSERRLQAIMFTDIKGYSAMMGADEAATIRAVREHREIVRACLARHHGREQRTAGDAFFVLFDSALDAVSCGLEIQERLAARNLERPAAEQVRLRIGVHAGDLVIDDDGEVSGDAVNTAARVEPLAPVGGVAVTDVVAAQVRGRLQTPLVPLPPAPMKNIANPPALFAVGPAGVAPPGSPAAAPPSSRSRWGLVGALLAALTLGAVAVWARRAAPPVDPVAQARWTAALDAWRRNDSRAEALARAAVEADPDGLRPMLLLAEASMGDEEPFRRALRLAEGRDDPDARLARLVVRSVREHAGGVSAHEGSALTAGFDGWIAEHPEDEFGQLLAALHYPIHGDEPAFHADDPGREHLNAGRLRAFVQAHPDWAVARVALVNSQSAAHDAEALPILDEGLRSCPECAALDAVAGQWLLLHGRADEARARLRRALEVDPGMHFARALLADVALRQDDEPERVRLVAAMLAPEQPARVRAEFAASHAVALAERGRVREGEALLREADAAFGDQRDADGQGRAHLAWAQVLAGLAETARAAAAADALERLVARPALGEVTRGMLSLKVCEVRSMIAWQARDLDAARATLAVLESIPPDPDDKALPAALDDARARVAVLRHDPAALETLASQPVLPGCGPHLWRAEVYAAFDDPRSDEELALATDPEQCRGDVLSLVWGHLLAGERTHDPDARARHLAAIDALWPRADPDLALEVRRAALRPGR